MKSTDRVDNLFEGSAPVSGEQFDVLARFGGTTIERILSSAEPGETVYLQAHDEWVTVLRGAAELEVDGARVKLGPGDHLALPAGTPHRVLSTEANTLWLAVHVKRG